ncbi:MAG: glycosyltransferase 87 family protein [Chloroflexota bacterium]
MTALPSTGRRLLTEPFAVGRLTLPPPGIVLLAAIGSVLLLVTAVTRWATPSDEHAYWLAARRLVDGLPLYDPAATSVTPYAYWYPPVVAQVLVPVALVLPELWFTGAWTVLMLGCLWWLGGRNVLVALALVAFPPVAVEFWFRNIHLVLAALLVLSTRRAWLVPVGAAIKLSPGLGLAWLAAAGRWRDTFVAAGVGLVILAASVVISPAAWGDWISIAMSRGPGDVASFLPIPFAVRAVAGLAVALLAGRLRSPWSEVLLVVAVTVALPTLWFTALSLLIAVVPMWRRHGASAPAQERPA